MSKTTPSSTSSTIQNAFGGPMVNEKFESLGSQKPLKESMEVASYKIKILRDAMQKNNEKIPEIFENIRRQLAFTPSLPPNLLPKIEEAEYQFNQGNIEIAQMLMTHLEKDVNDTIFQTQIQEHAEKATAYLVDSNDPKNPVINVQPNNPAHNPFYGNLRSPARVNYQLKNGEKNYAAQYAQEALNGLPIYEKDATTPKIYEAISPNGGEKRVIYWSPNTHIKNFEGHWAMKGQMPDHKAFIPDGWTIREIEKPEEKIAAKQEIAQKEPEIQKEQQKIDTAIQNPETRKETAKILAARFTETLRKEMQSAEKSGMTESFIACFNAHFASISKPAEIKKPEIATKAVPQTTAVSVGETAQQEITAAESETPEMQEQEGVRYITHLLSTISEAEQEKQPEEAMEAVVTLEEIFESIEITIPQEETTPEEKTVKMDDLLAEQKAPLEEESVEIERRIGALKTKTLETLQYMRLTFE